MQASIFYGQICCDVKWFCDENWSIAFVAKVVCDRTIIKKHRYCPKNVPGGIIDRIFLYKELGDVDMLEADTENYKTFRIF